MKNIQCIFLKLSYFIFQLFYILFKDYVSLLSGCTALSTPSSPTPLTLPGLLSERMNAVKATSLPNVFAREMQVCRSRTSLVVNPSPKCKYSRLKIISLKTAEGMVKYFFLTM